MLGPQVANPPTSGRAARGIPESGGRPPGAMSAPASRQPRSSGYYLAQKASCRGNVSVGCPGSRPWLSQGGSLMAVAMRDAPLAPSHAKRPDGARMSGSHIVFESLIKEGVDLVFGLPGG